MHSLETPSPLEFEYCGFSCLISRFSKRLLVSPGNAVENLEAKAEADLIHEAQDFIDRLIEMGALPENPNP